MCCHQRLAVRCQLPQKIDPHAGRLHGVVFEAVVPVGVFETNFEHSVAGERQPLAPGCQSDHAVPGRVPAGALDEHPRCHFIFRFERPQLTAVLVQEPLGCPPKRVRKPRRHGDTGEIRRHPELGLGGRKVDAQVRTQPVLHPVGEQSANVVHVHMGQHHVGHGCEIDAGGIQSLHQPPGPRQVQIRVGP